MTCVIFMTRLWFMLHLTSIQKWFSTRRVNSLRHDDVVWCHKSWSTLVQVLACCQGIIWTNADLLSIGPQQTNVNEIWIKIWTFSFMNMDLKMPPSKVAAICSGPTLLSVVLGPVLPQQFDTVTIVSANGGAAFKESCAPNRIWWQYRSTLVD